MGKVKGSPRRMRVEVEDDSVGCQPEKVESAKVIRRGVRVTPGSWMAQRERAGRPSISWSSPMIDSPVQART